MAVGEVITDFKPVEEGQIITGFQPVGYKESKAYLFKPQPELPPFPIDDWLNKSLSDLPDNQKVEQRSGFAKVLYGMTRPWEAAGYSAGSSINRTIAHFTDTFDVMARFAKSQGLPIGSTDEFIRKMTDTYDQNADWWQSRADKVGVNFLTELAGEAFALPANALIGITDFVMKVSSGFSIPAMVGFQEAKEHDTDPFIGGLLEAAKFKSLDVMFKLVAPFNRYIQSIFMGSVFGTQAAVEAPPGTKTKAFIKGAAPGIGLGLMSPGGEWGMKDIYPEIGRSVPEIRKEIEAFEKPTKKPLTKPLAKEKVLPEVKPTILAAVKSEEGNIYTAQTHPEAYAKMEEAGDTVTNIRNRGWIVDGKFLRDSEVDRGILEKKIAEAPPVSEKPSKETIMQEIVRKDMEEAAKRPEEVMPILGKKLSEIQPEAKVEGVEKTWQDREIRQLKKEAEVPNILNWVRDKGGIDPKSKAADVFELTQKESGYRGKSSIVRKGGRALDVLRDEAEWEGIISPGTSTDEFGDMIKSSVGAEALGAQYPPNIDQLTSTIGRNVPRDSSLGDRISVAEKLSRTYTGVRETAGNAFEKIKATGSAIKDWYFRPPQWTTFDDMLGKYLGGRQISGKRTSDWAKEIQNNIPKSTQEAITNWAQAGGDRDILTERMNSTTNPELKRGYQEALNLGDEDIVFARNIHQYFNAKLDDAIEAGILDHGVENYVNQIWEKGDPVGVRLKAEINAGMLRNNPSFAKRRIFESYFEGEQTGKIPKDKRIGYLVSVYENSFNEAIGARQFIKSMFDGEASDGRPLVTVRGSGSVLPKDESPPEVYLIRPRTTPEEAFDYKEISHPALRKWKWVSKDADGNPIFVEGDVIIHPEIYDKLNNVLSRSTITESKLGKGLLIGSREFKSTLLSLSSFHQVQIGVHAVFHWENPFNAPKLDFEQPIQKELVNHGLMVYNHNALAEFAEGLSTAGLTNRIPGVGSYLQKYTEYLFQDLIPRLKMKLATDMIERNTPRYPDLSRDQIVKLSSDQANAAFGELNYKQMGRNPTTQDMFRIGALAPDFLEARMRFAGQAMKPYGREQAIALIRGATMMYFGAKLIEGIAEQVDPDKNKIHWDRPFSVTLDDREYSLRSVPGDIYHLVRDPRSFVYHRLNPSITKPLVVAITGRDVFGKRRDAVEQVKDYVTGAVPIPGQGFFTKGDQTIYDSILQSMGVSSWNYRTEAERIMLEIQREKTLGLPKETEERAILRNQLAKDYGKTGDMKPIMEAIKTNKILPGDLKTIIEKQLKTPVERGVSRFSPPEALKVWRVANDEEKTLIQPIIIREWFRWKATPEEKQPFESKIKEVIDFKGAKP